MSGGPAETARCDKCHQCLPSIRMGCKRERSDEATKQLVELPPPIVQHYAPYTSGQLLSVPERQMKACADQWDRYYRNNTVNGYKDRHYLTREFTELRERLEAARQRLITSGGGSSSPTTIAKDAGASVVELIEIGCGVGNAVIPMLEEYSDLGSAFVAFGFDISAVAVDLLRAKVAENTLIRGRLVAIPHDLAEADLMVPGPLLAHPVALGTIIFVLCSVPVPLQQAFVHRVASLIAVGGTVFVRDYCAGDLAEHRFVAGKRFAPSAATSARTAVPEVDTPSPSTYLRSNGTLSHFFTVDSLTRLFLNTQCFQVLDATVMERSVDNRREGLTMSRKFVQARFLRVAPPNPSPTPAK